MSTEDKVLENGDNIEAVRKQIEYYFSKENLQSDVYLTSQMDAQMSVPISVVMKFAKLKALTQGDEAILRKAVEASTTLSILDNRIKAIIKSNGRSTIILREIPSDAPEEEVKEIFNYEGCKTISSIRSDIGDTWFVVMETEEDAKDTALDLRLKKRTFRSLPVKARIKTEPVVRSFFPLNTVPVPPVYPMNPMIPFAPMVPDMGIMPYGFVAPPVVETTTTSNSSVENAENVDTTTVGDDTEGKGFDETTGDNQFNNKQGGIRSKDVRSRVPRATTTAPRDSDIRKRERRAGERPVKDRTEKKPDVPFTKPPIEVNAMTFPPLLGAEETPIPTPGYKEDFIKYNMDELIVIVKNVKEAQLPSEVKAEEHSLALTTTPNLDLLKRQRTFSIDETREQLRQGKPVQREAIISGAVDYRSLMYGDDSHGAANAAKDVSTEQAAPTVHVPSSSVANATDSVVTETPKDAAAAESAANTTSEVPPSSPTKISASTWAAMVKSSAAATQAEAASVVTNTNNNNNNNVPRSASKAKPSNNSGSNNNNSGKAAEKPAEQTPVKGKNKNNNDNNKGEKSHEKKSAQKANKDEKKNQKKSSEGETQDSETTNDVKAVETATEKLALNDTTHDTTNASGWGGKASFANVLKQKLTEEEESKATADAGKASSANDKNKNKNKSTSDQGLKNNNNNASGSGPNTFRAARTNNTKTTTTATTPTTDRDAKKPSPANADGMWVKETLPALPADK